MLEGGLAHMATVQLLKFIPPSWNPICFPFSFFPLLWSPSFSPWMFIDAFFSNISNIRLEAFKWLSGKNPKCLPGFTRPNIIRLQATCDLICYSPAMVASFLSFSKPSMFPLLGLCTWCSFSLEASPLDADMAHSLTSIQASLKISLAEEGFPDPSI